MRHAYVPVLAIALTAACTAAPNPGPALVADPVRMQAHFSFLADDALQGRATGQPGYAVAAAYVATQMAAAGLDVTLQQVPYRAAKLDIPSARVSVFRGRRETALAWRTDFTMGPDIARDSVAVRAPAVFVGYGVSAPDLGHDDYADVDVRGRIIVVLGGAPKSFSAHERAYYSSGLAKTAAAVEAGAIGVVGMRNAYFAGRYAWDAQTANAGVRPSLAWVGPDGTIARYHEQLLGNAYLSDDAATALFEGARMSREEILAADTAGEPLPAFELPVEIALAQSATHTEFSAPNVVGVLTGADEAVADEFVVFSAHLDGYGIGNPVDGDEIYNGAYDNAMGVAVLLEAARLFASRDARSRRSVAFVAVGAEENGLLGSDYFAQYPAVDGRLVANVNLDMPLMNIELSELVGFGAELTSLGTVAADAAAAEGMVLVPDNRPDEVLFVRSDHYSFVRAGVPALFLKPNNDWPEFMTSHYHKPSDEPTLPVHWPTAQRFAQVNARIGLAVANADAAPVWTPGNFFTERFARKEN